MSTVRKMQILIALKFSKLKSAKFYSSQIKWVYSTWAEAVTSVSSSMTGRVIPQDNRIAHKNMEQSKEAKYCFLSSKQCENIVF